MTNNNVCLLGNGFSNAPSQKGTSPSVRMQQDRTSPMPHKQTIQHKPPSPVRGIRPDLHVVIPPSHSGVQSMVSSVYYIV